MTNQFAKIITLYGINNLGKTTQAEMLAQRLESCTNTTVPHIKFPVYDLEPTGPIINGYLRGENRDQYNGLSIQKVYTQNRFDYTPEIERMMSEHRFLIFEDYTGTGIAWGMANGGDKEMLIQENDGLIVEDLAFLLDGERFTAGIEVKHAHEQNNDMTERSRLAHQDLATYFGWEVINANQELQEVHQDIWQVITSHFDLLQKPA